MTENCLKALVCFNILSEYKINKYLDILGAFSIVYLESLFNENRDRGFKDFQTENIILLVLDDVDDNSLGGLEFSHLIKSLCNLKILGVKKTFQLGLRVLESLGVPVLQLM